MPKRKIKRSFFYEHNNKKYLNLFSKQSIKMHLKLQEYKVNRINILNLYLNTRDKLPENKFEYNKNEVSYSIFEHNTSIIPSKSSSNPVSIVLNNIAHRFNI